MQNPAYLTLSEHRIYHFRWPLPLHLMKDSKRRYVKLSLGTREPQEALHLAKRLSYAAQHLIRHDRWQGMEFIQIKKVVHAYFQQLLEEEKKRIDDMGLNMERTQTYLKATQPDVAAGILFAKEEHIDETRFLYDILDKMGLDIYDKDPDWKKLRMAFRAAIPSFSAELARYTAATTLQYDFQPKPVNQPVALLARPHNAGLHTVGQTIDKFITAHVNDKAWDDNTRDNREAKLDVLQGILGKDFLMADIDQMKAREVRDIIKRLPKNLNKNPLVRDLPLMEAIKAENAEKISTVTAQMYINAYSTFFQWCVNEGVVGSNPFTKLKASVDKKKKTTGLRKPFNAEQVKRIQGAIKDEEKHYRRWGTLLGMYTGARLNELAQIMLDDIKQKDGIWHFHMNDDGEDKKLKTPAARRLVPVHKALLDLGIIEEVARLRKAGHDRFLHDLTYCKKNGYGKKLGHYFNQVLLVRLGLKKPELVFHSFRHTANTCLYQAGVPEAIVHMLIGHERSGTSQQVYFKEGYTLHQLKDAMDKYDPTQIIINSD